MARQNLPPGAVSPLRGTAAAVTSLYNLYQQYQYLNPDSSDGTGLA